MTFNQLMFKVREATQRNFHTESIRLVAEFLEMEDETIALKTLEKEHMELGHLSSHLYDRRQRLYTGVMGVALQRLPSEDFMKLYGAF